MVQWTNLVIFDIYVIVLHNCNTVNMSTTTGSCRIPVAKYFLIAMLLDFAYGIGTLRVFIRVILRIGASLSMAEGQKLTIGRE